MNFSADMCACVAFISACCSAGRDKRPAAAAAAAAAVQTIARSRSLQQRRDVNIALYGGVTHTCGPIQRGRNCDTIASGECQQSRHAVSELAT